ncbi:hypothetical protein GIB67_035355, partial [Kingdonia uniflora]
VATKLEVFPGSEFCVAYEEAVKYGRKRRLAYGPSPFSHLLMMWASCIMYQDRRSWMGGSDVTWKLMKSLGMFFLPLYMAKMIKPLLLQMNIHKGFYLRQGISSPISDLTERLLLEESDPPPVPQESLYEAPLFDEVDIQALAHAVELTIQDAVESLEFSKGNLFQSFQVYFQLFVDVLLLPLVKSTFLLCMGLPQGLKLFIHRRLGPIF